MSAIISACVEASAVGIGMFSDKQHRGNEGEGQFHLNENNIEYHRRNFLEQELTYAELYNLLK